MAKKKMMPTEHEFSLSSGQMVGLIVGQVVIILLAFVAGLLVGRYEIAQERLDLARRPAAPARTAAVPLPSRAAPRTRTRTQETPAAQEPTAPKQTAVHKKPQRADVEPAKAPVKPIAPSKPTALKTQTAKKQPAAADKKPAEPTTREKPRSPTGQKPQTAAAQKKEQPPAAPEPVEPVRPTKPAEGKFCVQVFASRSARVTGNYVKRLQQAGFDAWVKPATGGDRWHRAMIGRYATHAEATAALKELRQKKQFAEAWIPPAG